MPDAFVAIIDAGSTSSRLLLYKYDSDVIRKHRNTKPLDFKMACSKTGAVMKATYDVKAMKTVLRPLLDACVPENQHQRTVPLYIMATAGMRGDAGEILPASTNAMRHAWNAVNELQKEGNPSTNRRGVYNIGLAYRGSPTNTIRDRHSFVVPAMDEGVYGWIALNHGLDRSDSWMPGILELGGKSLQVAYADVTNGNGGQAVCLWNRRYYLRSRSWVLGAEESRLAAVERKLVDAGQVVSGNPCLPSPQRSKLGTEGTPMAVGNGNFPECLRMAKSYLNTIPSPPSLDIQHSANRFYSLSSFWFTYEFFAQFGVYSVGSPYDPTLFRRAVDKYCTRSWFPYGQEGPLEHNHKHCFAAAWMIALFHENKGFQLRLSDHTVWNDLIHFPETKALQDRSSWTIGAALMAVRHNDVKLFCRDGEENGAYPPIAPAADASPTVLLTSNRTNIPSIPSSPVVTPPILSLVVESDHAPIIPRAIADSLFHGLPLNELNSGSTFVVGLVSGILLIALVLIGYRRFSTRRVIQLPISDAKNAVQVGEVVRTAFFDKGKGAIFLAGAENISFV